MTDVQTRIDGNNCFVCGKGNEKGLKMHFRLDGEVCRSAFTPAEDHCGFHGVTHGGIIFSALDDVMANWIYLNGIRAFTARCDIRYRAPLPTGTPVAVEGRCLKKKGRLMLMHGVMTRTDTDEVVAEAEASFFTDRTQ